MNNIYSIDLKKKVCEDICLNGKSTLNTANEYNIPIKTLEKWITSFNKDNHCFDPKSDFVNDFKLVDSDSISSNYDNLSHSELKKLLMKKDIEIARLKKNYSVKEGGTEKKVFITFSKKNTK